MGPWIYTHLFVVVVVYSYDPYGWFYGEEYGGNEGDGESNSTSRDKKVNDGSGERNAQS